MGVTGAVIGQTQNFIDRCRNTTQGGCCGGGITCGGVFVDVVAQMQSVFGNAFGYFGINVEIACRLIAAAHHGQFQAGSGGGLGAGAAHGESDRAVDKAEEIAGARHQASGIGLGRKICVGFGF